MKLIGFLLITLFYVNIINCTRTVNNYLTENDQKRLNNVFLDGLKSTDLQAIYYSVINLKSIKNDEKTNLCSKISSYAKDSKISEIEKNFYYVAIHKELACKDIFPENVQSSIKNSLSKDLTTAQDIYYSLNSLKLINEPIDDTLKGKIVKNLQTILKKDDTLLNLGYSFYIASDLGANSGKPFGERIEDAIVQADEVDGKMLQFEGGLSITSLVLNGAFKLSKTLNKQLPITPEQSVKFSNYLLSRRSVQIQKGVSVLLEALNTIVKEAEIAPICMQVLDNGQIKPDTQVLSVKICDLFGNKLDENQLKSVQATIAVKQGNTVLVDKENLVKKPNADNTLYELSLKDKKLTRGIYKLSISTASTAYDTNVFIKMLGRVKITQLEIGVSDVDSTSSVKKQQIVYPNKLDKLLYGDSLQKVLIKLTIIDELTTKPITINQVFINFVNKVTNDEIIFIAEQDTNKVYKFDMDIGLRSTDFLSRNGLYTIELIIGDTLIVNNFKWLLGDIELKFSNNQSSVIANTIGNTNVKAEIIHQFRTPDVRPPLFVSNLFTVLCSVPLLILFALLLKLKINIGNFNFNLSTIIFHLGFGAILGLFYVFWLQLNMFDTIKYLIPIGFITFLAGNRLLRGIANKK